jgi:hypothetical protein
VPKNSPIRFVAELNQRILAGIASLSCFKGTLAAAWPLALWLL